MDEAVIVNTACGSWGWSGVVELIVLVLFYILSVFALSGDCVPFEREFPSLLL